MADNTRRPNLPTPTQLALVLADIAESAQAIARFVIAQAQDDEFSDERDIEARRVAIETLAQRIGLLADFAAEPLGTVFGSIRGSQVEDWMLPPQWHSEEAERVGNGEQENNHAR
jgi:hypothetical protein